MQRRSAARLASTPLNTISTMNGIQGRFSRTSTPATGHQTRPARTVISGRTRDGNEDEAYGCDIPISEASSALASQRIACLPLYLYNTTHRVACTHPVFNCSPPLVDAIRNSPIHSSRFSLLNDGPVRELRGTRKDGMQCSPIFASVSRMRPDLRARRNWRTDRECRSTLYVKRRRSLQRKRPEPVSGDTGSGCTMMVVAGAGGQRDRSTKRATSVVYLSAA